MDADASIAILPAGANDRHADAAPPPRWPARVADRVFGLVFCAVVLLNFVSAVARYLGSQALIGADEVQVYAMVWLIWLGAAVVGWRQLHLRMDVFTLKLGPRGARVRNVFEALLMACACAAMAWVSFGFVRRMHALAQLSDGAGIPMWIPHSAVLVGFVVLTAAAVRRCWQLLVRGAP